MQKRVQNFEEAHKALVVVLSGVAATLGDVIDNLESYQASRDGAPDWFVENQLSDVRHARGRVVSLIETFAHSR